MNLLYWKQRFNALPGLCRGKGPQSSDEASSANTTNTSTTTVTQNTDRRIAVSDGVGVSGDGNRVQINDPDVVKAIASMGGDVLKQLGGAIVDINKTSADTNRHALDSTMNASAKLVDRLTDSLSQGFNLAEKTVSAFQPNENKGAETMKYLGFAVIGVAAVALVIQGKK